MSAGLHRAWKSALLTAINPPKDRPFRHLDVAGGTGDVAFSVLEAGGPQTQVTVLDINAEMLSVGRDRAAKRFPDDDRIAFVQGNAEELGLPDNHFDAYTIAFGIRNVTHIDMALREAHRVLKFGGRFFCLEFSTTTWPGFSDVYDSYSHKLVPQLGKLFANDADSYRYLIESIRRFPPMPKFEGMIRDAGFVNTKVEPILGGLVAIHSGWKI
jgi:demethylmenaquinone methyltransferase/2-methoxy-6-polyprenyl-1,4-benzoquinol methylase